MEMAMNGPTEDFRFLVELLNIDTKKKLTKFSKSIVVRQDDFVAFILGAQHGIFAPYKYANEFRRDVPQHLYPKNEEHAAIRTNGVGPYRTKEAKKFARKIFQMPKNLKTLAAHLLYTPDHKYWHLFYFSHRDREESGNHWRAGSHIHFVSYLWGGLPLEEAWTQVQSGKITMKALHIQYEKLPRSNRT